MSRRLLRFALWTASTALLAVALSAQAAGDGALVAVDAYRLNPATVTVGVGEGVTFQVDQDETLVDPMEPLTLVADDGSFRSPALEPGDRWRLDLERTGIYRYHVDQHPSVEGTIIVE